MRSWIYEILTTQKSGWIGEQTYLQMLGWEIYNTTTHIWVVIKMLDQDFNVSLFSNPGDQALILVKSKGQICPIVFYLFRTLSPGFEKNYA